MKILNTTNNIQTSPHFQARMLRIGDHCYPSEALGIVARLKNGHKSDFVAIFTPEIENAKHLPNPFYPDDDRILFIKEVKSDTAGELYKKICEAVNAAKYEKGGVVDLNV